MLQVESFNTHKKGLKNTNKIGNRFGSYGGMGFHLQAAKHLIFLTYLSGQEMVNGRKRPHNPLYSHGFLRKTRRTIRTLALALTHFSLPDETT